jgi:hypothetical protein
MTPAVSVEYQSRVETATSPSLHLSKGWVGSLIRDQRTAVLSLLLWLS